MKLKYKPGQANVVANGLSRAPRKSNAGEVQVATSEATADSVLVRIQKEQQQDEELADLLKYLMNKELPDCVVRR